MRGYGQAKENGGALHEISARTRKLAAARGGMALNNHGLKSNQASRFEDADIVLSSRRPPEFWFDDKKI
jgi:hypothetical protein